MKRLRIALIGCGRIAYKHVEAIAKQKQADLVAVCDIVPERATAKAAEYAKLRGVKPVECHDYRLMLEQEDLDVVAIATESGNHAEIALACLRYGKHVLVEKPMALSTADADAMIACAAEHQVQLCVAHQNRFNLPIQKLRAAVEAGRFGKLVAGNARILWNRNAGYYEQASWRGTYAQDGGCLMNQCIHNIDILQWMLGGEIAKVQAMLGNYLHPYIEAEDYGSIQLRFANGAIGNVEGTVCIYPQNLEETLTLIGEKGTVVIGGTALNRIVTWQFADGLDSLEVMQAECNAEIDNVYGSGHTPLYADFLQSVFSGKPPLVDGHEGKKGMAIILHAYLAAQQEKTVVFGQQDIASLDFLPR